MKTSRILLILFILLSVGGLLTSAILSGNFQHPETAILGDWKESSWTYEIVDSKSAKRDSTLTEQNPTLEHDVFSQLIIHKSEKWKFGRNSSLILHKPNDRTMKVKWNLKGRGHILKLTYSGDTTEYYQIKELTNKRMVLHFENDVHAKGIVKIVFTRK